VTPGLTRRNFLTRLAMGTAGVMLSAPSSPAEETPIRVGVSMDTLAGANINDARAAYRVWGDQISQTLALRHARMLEQVFFPTDQMTQLIRTGQIDCFALTALEYARALEFIDQDVMMVEDYSLNGIENILLVHRDSPYGKLADLKGLKLPTLHHRDTALFQAWLDVELARAGLPPADKFFETIAPHDKASEVLLPLFFRREQVAGISRRAFDLACELNPQLGRDLRVLATSPRIIPVGFWFRKGGNADDKRAFQQAMQRLSTVTAGRQVLALYQSTGFAAKPCSIMAPTLDLIRQYERTRRRPGRGA
jgi:ABC-type phosphate/phosphonate transport system substrate-binding protein